MYLHYLVTVSFSFSTFLCLAASWTGVDEKIRTICEEHMVTWICSFFFCSIYLEFGLRFDKLLLGSCNPNLHYRQINFKYKFPTYEKLQNLVETFTPYNEIIIFKEQLCTVCHCPIWIFILDTVQIYSMVQKLEHFLSIISRIFQEEMHLWKCLEGGRGEGSIPYPSNPSLLPVVEERYRTF